MTMQLSFSLDTTQALNGIWEVVGTELMLFSLFCMGFIVCRPRGVQQTLQGLLRGEHPRSIKTREAMKFQTRAKKVVEEDSSPVSEAEATPCRSRGFSLSKDAFAFRRRSTSSMSTAAFSSMSSVGTASTSSLDSVSSENAHGHALRIRTALQEKQLDQALACARAMEGEGCTIPIACVMACARLAREMNRRPQEWLEALPQSVHSPRALPALLEQAAKAGDIPLMREAHSRLIARNVTLSACTTEALLRAYAIACDGSAVEVFEDLLKQGYVPGESVLIAVISLCAESKHVKLAERVMEYVRQTYKQVPLELFAALLKVYSHSKLHQKACDLYSEMQHNGVKPDTVVYGSLIRSAVECSRLELARQLFKESGNPDLLNYMSLIRAAGREKDVPKAMSLLEELENSPAGADITAYNCVLEVCAASGAFEEAERLMKRMEGSSQVDVVSYNTFLKVLLANGKRSRTSAMLTEMRSRGLQPNSVTYNSIVKDAVTNQDVAHAWMIVEQMEKDGVPPDAFTCAIIMKGVRHSCTPDDVDKTIAVIERVGVTPDEVLVNCLLDACVRFRCVQRISRILDQFRATGVMPSMHTCATLIRAYGHGRRLDRAQSLWRELIEDRRMQPSEEVFGAMVDACLQNSDVHAAVSALRAMSKVGQDLSKNASAISTLIKACAQLKEARLAVDIFEEVKDACVVAKVAYNTLIDAVVRQGDMSRATEIFKHMGLKAVTPDLITYSTLIKGHCARGDLEQGLMLLSQMQRLGIKPDQILFNSILDGCAHKQMRTLTEMVLGDMEKAGIAPSNFTLSILVKLYGRCNDLSKAFEVVDTFPGQYGFTLNAQVYTCLMSACIANGELARALEVHQRMERDGCPGDAKTYSTLVNGCLKQNDLEGAVKLIDQALDRTPRVWLSPDTVEGVLFMTSRRGRADDLGRPLLHRLMDAGVSVPDRVRTTLAAARG
mmetsp:Transcript_67479/g.161926  ORF Transcript_67479/g.161926 Transcript_67479/m.161926 type:complete len:953 (+) Transcript_67479:151-3009(+)